MIACIWQVHLVLHFPAIYLVLSLRFVFAGGGLTANAAIRFLVCRQPREAGIRVRPGLGFGIGYEWASRSVAVCIAGVFCGSANYCDPIYSAISEWE